MCDQMGLTALEREMAKTVPLPVIKPRPAANDAVIAVQLPLDIKVM
jgi:hypothetical protein